MKNKSRLRRRAQREQAEHERWLKEQGFEDVSVDVSDLIEITSLEGPKVAGKTFRIDVEQMNIRLFGPSVKLKKEE